MPRLENPRKIEQLLLEGASRDAASLGHALQAAGAVGEIVDRDAEGALTFEGYVLDRGRSLHVTVEAGDEGVKSSCECSDDPPCAHAVALARQYTRVRERLGPQAAMPKWRLLIGRMAPYRPILLPLSGQELLVHRLVPVPVGGRAYSLAVSWYTHKANKRGLGTGTPVMPDKLSALGADLASPADRKVFELAKSAAEKPSSQLPKNWLQLNPEWLDQVLKALSNAPYVYWEKGQERVVFDTTPLLPRIIAVEEGDRLKLSGEWVMVDGKRYWPVTPRILAGPNPWLLDSGVLRPVYGVVDGAALALFMEEGAYVNPSEIPAFLGSAVPMLQARGALVKVEAGFAPDAGSGEAPVVPVLYLSEEGGNLEASLRFKYAGYEVASENPDPVLLIETPGRKIRIQRDLDQEFEAVRELRSLGFSPVLMGSFELSGERALAFMHTELPRLAARWEVYGADTLKRHRVRQTAMTLNVRVSADNDWFDLWADVKAGPDEVELERVLKALKKGSKFVRLGDGSHAVMPEVWAERLGELLDDAGLTKGSARLERYLAGSVNELLKTADKVKIEQPMKWKKLSGVLTDNPTLPNEKPPKALSATLRPYQLTGYRWLIHLDNMGLGGVLADDMGLGKTIQALALLLRQKEKKVPGPSLVVSPTSVVHNWEQEAARHAPGLKTLRYQGGERGRFLQEFKNSDVVLTSYSILRRDIDELKLVDWNYVILDEAQAIKNAATQTARAAHSLTARRRLALTGTLLENHLGELWSHFNFLMPRLLGGQSSFVRKFERPIMKGDEEARDLLRARIRPFILRRMKSEVAPELPPKVENVLWSEFGPEQAKLYQTLLAAGRERVLRAVDEGGVAAARGSILDVLLRLRQVCCHPRVLPGNLGQGVSSAKFDQFCEFVSEVIEEGNRVLVYSQFVQVLKIIKDWFEKSGISHLYMDGRSRDREETVRRFQEDSTIPAFLVSLKAGGTGLNLTGADYVILYDPWWNPAVETQAADRAHRIGREGTVFFYRMVAKGSVEEKIRKLQEKKQAIAEDFVRSEHQWAFPRTREEILELFGDLE